MSRVARARRSRTRTRTRTRRKISQINTRSFLVGSRCDSRSRESRPGTQLASDEVKAWGVEGQNKSFPLVLVVVGSTCSTRRPYVDLDMYTDSKALLTLLLTSMGSSQLFWTIILTLFAVEFAMKGSLL